MMWTSKENRALTYTAHIERTDSVRITGAVAWDGVRWVFSVHADGRAYRSTGTCLTPALAYQRAEQRMSQLNRILRNVNWPREEEG